MPETESGADGQLDLKKRARRRLVGAAALALAAIIVLPMVMDQEPRPPTQDIQVRIPSQDGPRLAPAKPSAPVTDRASAAHNPAAAVEAPKAHAEAAREAPKEPGKEAAKEAGKEASKESPKETVREAAKEAVKPPVEAPRQAAADKPAKAAKTDLAEPKSERAAQAGHWVLQLGAYQDMANVRQLQARLKELGYPTYTEKVDTPQGVRTRVRGGPFASRQAAEQAQARLKKMGAGAPAGGVLAQKP